MKLKDEGVKSMKALCVDDELLPLEALERAVRKSPDIDEVVSFEDEFDALEWAKTHPVDVAFLDVEMHDMNGIELARHLSKLHPHISIIFCTGYEQYALNAIQLHLDAGYLVKPFRFCQIQKEIEHIKKKKAPETVIPASDDAMQPVTIRMMGEFSISSGSNEGTLVSSKMRKATSFLEYLILNYGVQIPKQRLINLFWSNYLYSNPESAIKALVSRLRRSLSEIRPDLENCIVSDTGSYSFRIVPGMSIDVLRLRQLFQQLETDHDPSAQDALFLEIQKLYKSDLYFPGDFIGGETFITDLHSLYLKAVLNYTERLQTEKKYNQVIDICKTALKVDPFDESLYLRIMEAKSADGHSEDAMREYERLSNLQRKHLNTEPSLEVRSFYENLCRQKND